MDRGSEGVVKNRHWHGEAGCEESDLRDLAEWLASAAQCCLCGGDIDGDDWSGDPPDSHQSCRQELDEGVSP